MLKLEYRTIRYADRLRLRRRVVEYFEEWIDLCKSRNQAWRLLNRAARALHADGRRAGLQRWMDALESVRQRERVRRIGGHAAQWQGRRQRYWQLALAWRTWLWAQVATVGRKLRDAREVLCAHAYVHAYVRGCALR